MWPDSEDVQAFFAVDYVVIIVAGKSPVMHWVVPIPPEWMLDAGQVTKSL